MGRVKCLYQCFLVHNTFLALNMPFVFENITLPDFDSQNIIALYVSVSLVCLKVNGNYHSHNTSKSSASGHLCLPLKSKELK